MSSQQTESKSLTAPPVLMDVMVVFSKDPLVGCCKATTTGLVRIGD